MRYEKAETVLRIAIDMQGATFGVSLDDIQRNYSDDPISRRTAERIRDALERLFPQLEQANPGETPKRWRLPGGTVNTFANITAEELTDLTTCALLLRRENMTTQADSVDSVIGKMRAVTKRPLITRLDPDVEALTEAEGLAARPGPRLRIDPEIVFLLRRAILENHKVRLHYVYRASGKRGYETVRPYGFLYGNRHYLVAWSESEHAKDFRNFALSNIERVEPLAKNFLRKPGFSLSDYAVRSFGVFQEEARDVVWKFSAKVAADAKDYVFHPTQKMDPQPDGSLIVTFRCGGLLEMSWHLFTWGDQVEIIKPKRLAKMMRDQSQILLRRISVGSNAQGHQNHPSNRKTKKAAASGPQPGKRVAHD